MNFFLLIQDSVRGRHWPLRLVLWIFLGWIFYRHLRDPEFASIFEGINLGIHEFGHLICMPFGEWITVAGGSLVQCLVPVISLGMFARQNDFFAFTFSFVWLGTNLYGLSRYIGDARDMELPLVTPFGNGDGEVIHDWNYLLESVHLLNWDGRIAAAVHLAGTLCMIFGLLWGAWLLAVMIRPGTPPPSPRGPTSRSRSISLS